MSNFRKTQVGFTVAELLVSLAVGALLLSVGVPSYTSIVQNSNQISAANELLTTLHLARDLAITRNIRVTVCPSSTGTSCQAGAWVDGWLVFTDADGDGQVDADETVDRVVDGIEAESLSSTQFGASLTYRPNGRVMAGAVAINNGELTLCDQRGASHARVAIIDISGRPRISRSRMDGSTPVCP